MSNDLQTYINSRKHLLKMLIARGYPVPDKEIKVLPTKIESFDIEINKDNDNICLVFYEIDIKYGKEQLIKRLDKVNKYAKTLKNNPQINVIIVMLHKSGSTLEKYTKEYSFGRTGISIELWLAKDLQFDITENLFVPKHEIYKPQPNDDLSNIPLSKIQKILITDPQVRYLGAKIGDIIKITRTSETAGHTIVYRKVI